MNQRGVFESQKIWKMHESLLSSAGSSWSDWQPVNPGWFASPRADEYRERALEVLEQEFGASRLFVLKDPRICRLMPFWMSVLEQAEITPVALHIHRNPLEVAASLQQRDAFEPGYSNLLWTRHVLDAEAHSRNLPRSFISFSQLLQEWPRLLDQAQQTLGLSWPRFSERVACEIDDFLSSDLKHHTESIGKVQNNQMLSGWLRDVLAIMERWSQDGEDRTEHAKLDEIRAQLDATGPTFAMLQKLHNAARSLSQSDKELAEKDQHIEEQRNTLQAESQRASVRIAELEAEGKQAAAQIAAMRKEAEEHLAVTDAQVAELEALLAEVRAERDRVIEEQAAERVVFQAEIRRSTEFKRRLAAAQKVYASNSWRVTAPLRWVSLRLRRR